MGIRQGAGKYSVLELAAKGIMSYLPVPYAWTTNAVGVDHMQGVCLGSCLSHPSTFFLSQLVTLVDTWAYRLCPLGSN